MNIVVILGAPGSGKGTIAGRLADAEELWQHVSSGDLLRQAVKDRTPCGLEAEDYMVRGSLVPDKLIANMMADLMLRINNGSTLLLDGYPRTVGQVALLDETIALCQAHLHAVVQLEVPEDVLVERIAGRCICPKCGAGYHVTNIPPRRAGVCDNCGTALIVREDDAPETVRHRLVMYEKQTVPLLELYEQRGLLRRVPANGRIPEIVAKVKAVL